MRCELLLLTWLAVVVHLAPTDFQAVTHNTEAHIASTETNTAHDDEDISESGTDDVGEYIITEHSTEESTHGIEKNIQNIERFLIKEHDAEHSIEKNMHDIEESILAEHQAEHNIEHNIHDMEETIITNKHDNVTYVASLSPHQEESTTHSESSSSSHPEHTTTQSGTSHSDAAVQEDDYHKDFMDFLLSAEEERMEEIKQKYLEFIMSGGDDDLLGLGSGDVAVESPEKKTIDEHKPDTVPEQYFGYVFKDENKDKNEKPVGFIYSAFDMALVNESKAEKSKEFDESKYLPNFQDHPYSEDIHAFDALFQDKVWTEDFVLDEKTSSTQKSYIEATENAVQDEVTHENHQTDLTEKHHDPKESVSYDDVEDFVSRFNEIISTTTSNDNALLDQSTTSMD